jgi:hypothetical protein
MLELGRADSTGHGDLSNNQSGSPLSFNRFFLPGHPLRMKFHINFGIIVLRFCFGFGFGKIGFLLLGRGARGRASRERAAVLILLLA